MVNLGEIWVKGNFVWKLGLYHSLEANFWLKIGVLPCPTRVFGTYFNSGNYHNINWTSAICARYRTMIDRCWIVFLGHTPPHIHVRPIAWRIHSLIVHHIIPNNTGIYTHPEYMIQPWLRHNVPPLGHNVPLRHNVPHHTSYGPCWHGPCIQAPYHHHTSASSYPRRNPLSRMAVSGMGFRVGHSRTMPYFAQNGTLKARSILTAMSLSTTKTYGLCYKQTVYPAHFTCYSALVYSVGYSLWAERVPSYKVYSSVLYRGRTKPFGIIHLAKRQERHVHNRGRMLLRHGKRAFVTYWER